MEKIEQLFGQVIRDLRQRKNIPQEGLADLSGLHRTYISDVERGRRNISLQNIGRIATALQVSVSLIFTEMEHLNEKQL
ncbi:MAG: helix-turn-helix transcriptional regulator [Clostridiales Family XIII bacterium]|jgi:transcriptional regulator with XRE-family HTH domain|nr:helix-turn-helix transcriptional regulator [Clostridiales Family XIII bacterium]